MHCSGTAAGRQNGVLDGLQGNFRTYDKLRHSAEPPVHAESKLYTHLIVAQPTRELQPDFTSIPPLPQLEKLIAPNFRLKKDNMTDEF